MEKIARGLSAGRVQSVALRLIVEKERDIKAFVPEEYWDIHADTQTPTRETLRLQVTAQQGKTFDPKNEQQAMAAVQTLKNAAYQVRDREDKPTSSKPSAPFITSTLQQAASTRLSFGVKKNHDDGAASVRSRAHYLHAYRLHEPESGSRRHSP